MFIRREVRSLGPQDPTLKHYADAVAEMKRRSDGKSPDEWGPTSWEYQAAIHGTTLGNPLPTWNRCTHGSWFFVAWHRMFVYCFEEIVRSVVGELHGAEAAAAWALPYWNYCRGGEYASIPDAFRDPSAEGAENPLYVQQRRNGINGGTPLLDEWTEDEKALARPHFVGKAEFGGGEAPPHEQFWSQGGVFEQTPHNTVHVGVGGRGGWMANIDEAAKDPIFWLHHANIDRIWAQWLSQPNRKDPAEGNWLGQDFEFFDAAGQKTSMVCRAVVDTAALGYEYDAVDGIPSGAPSEGAGAPAPAPTPPPSPEGEPVSAAADPPADPSTEEQVPSDPKFVGATEETLTLTGESAAIPVEIDERAREEVREASRKDDPRHLYLNIEDVEGEVNPGTVYGIYLDLPKGADAAVRAQHHIGNVSFFGIEKARAPKGDEHGHSLRLSVEVGELLRSLGGGERYEGGELYVTFCPLTLPGEGAGEAAHEEFPVHIGRISLAIDA